MRVHGLQALLVLSGLSVSGVAHAHVTATVVGPALAGTTVELNLNVPHGCEGTDSYEVQVTLPAEFNPEVAAPAHPAPPRPMDNVFGPAVPVSNVDRTTTVTWTRTSKEAVHPGDTHFYKFVVRVKLPAAPFTTLYFPTVQTCLDVDGEPTLEARWTAVGGSHDHGSESVSEEGAAPSLFILPTRAPGWNKYMVNEHVHDFTVFRDAEIVWAGNKAYSVNAETVKLIEADAESELLDAIHPGTEIWVKY